MLHEPAVKTAKDGASDWKAKLGIKLFLLYCVTYAAFVGVAVSATDSLKQPLLAGTNRAVVFGIALIVWAFILGVVYNFLCTRKEDEMNNKGEGKP